MPSWRGVWPLLALVGMLPSSLKSEGVQNVPPLPPQDVLLWHVDYFELKTAEILWATPETLILSLKEFKCP